MPIPNVEDSISLMLLIKSYERKKIYLVLEKGKKHTQNVKRSNKEMKPSDSA